MTKKDLTSIRRLGFDIQKLSEQIQVLESSLEGKAIQYRETPGRSTKEHDSMASKVAKLIELKDRHREELLMKEMELESIKRDIDSLPSPEGEIIYLRYVDHLKWWEVGNRLNYSEAWCKEIHERVMDRLE